MMRSFLYIFLLVITAQAQAQQTEVQYLSGGGNNDMVQWDFYCTAGMNSGKWTTIGVPSCWELQGFGKYDYGFAKDSVRGKESGLYRKKFKVPVSWKGKNINIVFEGVMTDAEVKINGRLAGAKHQGAFYAFKYDISKLLNYGKENLLEVKVDKHSSNKSVNAAEREADYWLFGGIFRPVWLEVLPQTYIDDISIDAKADGSFRTKATAHGKQNTLSIKIFDKKGKLVAEKESAADNMQEYALAVKEPDLWSSEFPNLYKAVYTLSSGGKPVHTVEKKFGFRTVEVKQRDGIYVNGVKMKFKGVNRHSFRPESGRTTSYQNSVEDVLLIREMNMNAVRMSHYPPDGHFLDVCDSLGLYVIDELAGWHGHYDTPTGSLRVKEMVEHDRNHPSIVIWANGNEGGSNPELDQLFGEYDLQKRVVIHPWQLNNGIETQHYRQYNYGVSNFENGREIVMPTEFLHGWFDGGHGAGLDDYWNKMWNNPLSAGGFLWDFADQGVVRKDKKDSLDTDKHRGADGIVGPHHEKEGSFFTIKEVWSPILIERREIAAGFDGRFNIENRYQFANANSCTYTWKLKRIGMKEEQVLDGEISAPDIAAGGKGQLQVILPADWKSYDVLYITVKDQYQQELFTWSFTISRPAQKAKELVALNKDEQDIQIRETSKTYDVKVKDIELSFDRTNGLLKIVRNDKGIVPLSNGPVIQEGVNNFSKISYKYDKDKNLVISSAFDKKKSFNTLQWVIYRNGWIQLQVNYFPDSLHTKMLGINFDLPENQMRSVTYMGKGPYRVWKNRLKGGAFDVWNKKYNNTETGEQWDYPEFKGYHANFYGGIINTEGQSFAIATETEDLFLRLYGAKWKTDQWHNYEPWFPKGDISFMNAIPSIGSRTQTRETTGPMGQDNIYYDYEKDPTRALRIVLWFKFGDK
ncbi:glycoside hydrolase family 2 TIM barrel-domain containing protein [Niabella yanshanensis]|uniref:beta-galactosidase n=2 Tax=Niabella yanshanensis TaxID=577386 RepID=A0ABZ0W7R4_9BACT|nr:glycoside hydrolase family 2 TIM barrel-domain containing protein [Niabella yanshanensis]